MTPGLGAAGFAGPLTCLGLVLSAAYAAIAIKPCAPGLPRLLRCLPVLAFFLLCPFGFHRLIVVGNLGFVLTWLSSFKLLAACQGRGPLADPNLSVTQFICTMLFPLYTTKGHSHVRLGPRWFAGFALKVMLFACVTLCLADSSLREGLPTWVKHQVYAVYIFLFIGMTLDPLLPVLKPLLGLPLQPGMDQPYLSSSVREFWSRRWNQVVSCTLRDVVYLPIEQLSWLEREPPPPQQQQQPQLQQPSSPPDGRSSEAAAARPRAAPPARAFSLTARRRRQLAMCACFFVSGCMHELLNLYMCRRLSRQLRTLLFFVVQPPLILIQEAATSAVPSRLRNTRAFRVLEVVLTLGILSLSAEPLFWEHIEACGTDAKGFNEWAHVLRLLSSFGAS